MRNLLWTAMAVVVMLAGANNVLAQVAPTVQAKVNALAKPNKDCFATGTYTIPANKTVNKAIATWYEETPGGNLQLVGITDDVAPGTLQANKYITTDIRLTAGKSYTVIVQMYINGPGGPTDPVAYGPPGVQTGFAP
jgi:hypothetical protein